MVMCVDYDIGCENVCCLDVLIGFDNLFGVYGGQIGKIGVIYVVDGNFFVVCDEILNFVGWCWFVVVGQLGQQVVYIDDQNVLIVFDWFVWFGLYFVGQLCFGEQIVVVCY